MPPILWAAANILLNRSMVSGVFGELGSCDAREIKL